jgi:hypothetical protein
MKCSKPVKIDADLLFRTNDALRPPFSPQAVNFPLVAETGRTVTVLEKACHTNL